MNWAIDDLIKTSIPTSTLKRGDNVPEFILSDTQGTPRSVVALLQRGLYLSACIVEAGALTAILNFVVHRPRRPRLNLRRLDRRGFAGITGSSGWDQRDQPI
jgi:hypothetical protein